MTAATCSRCHNTGYTGDRFCSCPFATGLRDRIETAPEFAEFRRRRAEIDYMLKRIEETAIPVPEYRCARCKAPMHALQGCFPAFEGPICYACHTKPPEPRYLVLRPDNPEVN